MSAGARGSGLRKQRRVCGVAVWRLRWRVPSCRARACVGHARFGGARVAGALPAQTLPRTPARRPTPRASLTRRSSPRAGHAARCDRCHVAAITRRVPGSARSAVERLAQASARSGGHRPVLLGALVRRLRADADARAGRAADEAAANVAAARRLAPAWAAVVRRGTGGCRRAPVADRSSVTVRHPYPGPTTRGARWNRRAGGRAGRRRRSAAVRAAQPKRSIHLLRRADRSCARYRRRKIPLENSSCAARRRASPCERPPCAVGGPV